MFRKIFLAGTLLVSAWPAMAQTTYPSPTFGVVTAPALKSPASPALAGPSLLDAIGNPILFFPVTTQTYTWAGSNVVLGQGAGKNYDPAALENVVIGYWAGGSGGCNSNFGGTFSQGCPPTWAAAGSPGGTGLTGGENVYIGWGAGGQATTDLYMVGIGAGAFWQTVGGSNSVSIGTDSTRNGTTYQRSVAVGNATMRNINAQNDTAVGYGRAFAHFADIPANDALVNSGGGNSAFGYWSMRAPGLTSAATTNSAFGADTLMALTSGANNSVFGTYAGKAIASGFDNAIFGYSAAIALTTGAKNLILGYNVAPALTTGNGNILLGVDSNCSLPSPASNGVFEVCAYTGSTPLIQGDMIGMSLTVNGPVASTGSVFSRGYVGTGPVPTIDGSSTCPATMFPGSTLAAGMLQLTAACANTAVRLNMPQNTTNRWVCNASDSTTATLVRNVASGINFSTLQLAAGLNGDYVSYQCAGF